MIERINGILKQEFEIDTPNLSLELRKKLIKNTVKIYNNMRPHLSNYMLTPKKMHLQKELKIKSYKKQKVAT